MTTRTKKQNAHLTHNLSIVRPTLKQGFPRTYL